MAFCISRSGRVHRGSSHPFRSTAEAATDHARMNRHRTSHRSILFSCYLTVLTREHTNGSSRRAKESRMTTTCTRCDTTFRGVDRNEDGSPAIETTRCAHPGCEVYLVPSRLRAPSFFCEGCRARFCDEHKVTLDGMELCAGCADGRGGRPGTGVRVLAIRRGPVRRRGLRVSQSH